MNADLHDELRIPTKIILVFLILGGVGLSFVEQIRPDNMYIIDVTLLLFGWIGILWLLDDWLPWLTRWGVIWGMVAGGFASLLWFNVPETLGLLFIPVAVAVSLTTVRAAAFVAGSETVLIFLVWPWMPTLEISQVIVGCTAIWMVFALMTTLYSRLYQHAQSAYIYHQQARDALEQARSRQVKLNQALNDLLHVTRELKFTNQQLNYERLAAEEAHNAKADFVARVSHELRTPLNMIIGFGQIIAQSPETYGARLPQSLLADLAVILRNSQHLSDLVDDVLELSRVDAGQVTLTREYTDISDLIKQATTAIEPLFRSKSLYLETKIHAALPPIFCDRTRIREVLVNLLSNAGRFTECGGVNIEAWCEGGSVTISVNDTGPGITPQQANKLFQPFSQLEDPLRRRHGGTGLGLTISKSFVELHGGKMWLESQVGAGTNFLFRLPIDPAAAIQSTPVRWFSPLWEYRQHETRPNVPRADIRLRLVVQEPGHTLQHLLTKYIHNLEVASVVTFDEAVDELLRVPAQALVVNANAVNEELELIHKLEERLPYNLPVVICAIPDVFKFSSHMGITDYLLKPIDRDKLLATLKQLRLPNRKILIVDDDSEAVRLYWRMLTAPGDEYQILMASDGEQALAIIREQQPAVVLLDLVMPNMDGFQFLERRHQDPQLRQIPVIVASALDPAGNMVVSSSLAVTRRAGLSLPQFLACLEGLSRLFAAGKADEQAQPRSLLG